MVYARSANYYPWIEEIELENGSIKRISIVKCLVVMIFECLRFKDHIAFISTKEAKNVGTLRKLKNHFPKKVIIIHFFPKKIIITFYHICCIVSQPGRRCSLAIYIHSVYYKTKL